MGRTKNPVYAANTASLTHNPLPKSKRRKRSPARRLSEEEVDAIDAWGRAKEQIWDNEENAQGGE